MNGSDGTSGPLRLYYSVSQANESGRYRSGGIAERMCERRWWMVRQACLGPDCTVSPGIARSLVLMLEKIGLRLQLTCRVSGSFFEAKDRRGKRWHGHRNAFWATMVRHSEGVSARVVAQVCSAVG